MRLAYKIVLALIAAILTPLAFLGLSAYRSMAAIGQDATHEAVETLTASEKERLLERTRRQAGEIGRFLLSYENDVAQLRAAFERNHRNRDRLAPERLPVLYPEQSAADWPNMYGYVHPEHGAYADWEKRGAGCPWIPRHAVLQATRDPDLHARLIERLHVAMRLTDQLAWIGERHADSLDLAWVVTYEGAVNAHPPYDYHEVVRQEPGILDLDERSQDYVRRLTPTHNPERRELWLEPYLDLFHGVWVTSRAAPLYDGDEFLGSVGMDMRLPVVIEQVLRIHPGQQGYGFLLAPSGKLIAIPEQGIADLVWDERHRAALRHTFLPRAVQHWEPALVTALESGVMDASPDEAVREAVGHMRAGQTGVVRIELSGEDKLLAYAPLVEAGWSLGLVMPTGTVVASADRVKDTIEEATSATIRDYLLMALIAVFVSLGGGFLVHRLAVRPLERLTRELEQVRWDSLELSSPLERRRDEIGQLHARFADMIRAIRRARDDLSREKDRLAVTLASIGDGVIATDTEGRVALLNPVAEKLTGWHEEEARGRSLSTVLPLFDEATGAPRSDPAARILAAGAPIPTQQALLATRDGTRQPIATSGAPIRDREGAVMGVVLVFWDVAETRRVEDELAKIQRLESVRVLAAGIAHDFNNLLASVLGNVSLARFRMEGHPEAQGHLTEAEKALRRSRDLTNQLLTFSSGGAPLRHPITLGPLLGEATSFALRGGKLLCDLDVPEDLPPVLADEGQISQVVHNLVLNAAQAMPQGGSIRVTARALEIPPEDARPLAPGRYVEVSVRDQGPGVPPEDRGQIFDPFFTTKSTGSGLGLAVCFSVLTRHEGHIELAPASGQGAELRFYLPVTAESPAVRPVAAPAPPSGQGRVLVMDDEASIREVCQQMLRALGYESAAVADGAAALEAVRAALEEARPFDAVILDLTVPGGLGGGDVVAPLKEMAPALQAIVSSGYSHDPIMARYRDFGFAATVVKPYDLETLGATVAQVLAESANA